MIPAQKEKGKAIPKKCDFSCIIFRGDDMRNSSLQSCGEKYHVKYISYACYIDGILKALKKVRIRNSPESI
jgi:hypothetical protein